MVRNPHRRNQFRDIVGVSAKARDKKMDSQANKCQTDRTKRNDGPW